MKRILPVVLGAAMVFSGGNALAALTSCPPSGGSSCLGSDFTPTLDQDTEANVLTVINANLLAGGTALTSLTLLGKSDDPIPYGTGANTSATSGTWTAPNSVAFLSVKASTDFKVFDIMGATSGSWDTLGILNGGGKQPDLSHLSFWAIDPGNQVPLPAAAWLFISGLGALGVLRRQQTA